jgi:hypothetical protein
MQSSNLEKVADHGPLSTRCPGSSGPHIRICGTPVALADALARGEGRNLKTSNLFTANYTGLVRIAEKLLRHDRLRWHIESHELVHETFLRINAGDEQTWDTRAHFVRTAVVVMRHVLTDLSRTHSALKGGGNVQFVPLS